MSEALHLQHKSLKKENAEIKKTLQSLISKQEQLDNEKSLYLSLQAVKPPTSYVDVKLVEFEEILMMLKRTQNDHAKSLRSLVRDQKSMQVDVLKAEEMMKSNQSSVKLDLSGEKNQEDLKGTVESDRYKNRRARNESAL